MDRNQVIGFTLITLLLLLYFWLAKPSPEEQAARKKQEQTTQQNTLPKTSQLPQIPPDTSTQQKNFGDFWQHTKGTAKEVVLENKDVKITFNTQGGKLKTVLHRSADPLSHGEDSADSSASAYDSRLSP